jgi:hypothetical protein
VKVANERLIYMHLIMWFRSEGGKVVYRTEWWFIMSFLLYNCGSGYFYVKYVVQFFRLEVLCTLHDKSNSLGR